MTSQQGRTGVWLVDACGSVATTVAVGLAAMRTGAAGTAGLATEQPAFGNVGLVDLGHVVTGPMVIGSDPTLARESVAATDVFDLILAAAGLSATVSAGHR